MAQFEQQLHGMTMFMLKTGYVCAQYDTESMIIN